VKRETLNAADQARPLTLRDLDYPFDQKHIAQKPVRERDRSRLLVYRRSDESVVHSHFRELIRFLPSNCLLVLNDSKVIPARIMGRKAKTGGVVEILLLKELAPNRWRALTSPGLVLGQRINLGVRGIYAEVVGVLTGAQRVIDFVLEGNIDEHLDKIGKTPLPPYIKRPKGPFRSDRENYQTVYAHHPGSVAAPTAGLHFSEKLLGKLRKAKVELAFLTLHIGYATFQPLDQQILKESKLDTESFSISKSTARQINQAKSEGRPVVAVGTTTVRCLESAVVGEHYVRSGTDSTELFIAPGYKFRIVDALITNFHLPRSSLLALVGAFAGLAKIKRLYALAQKENYRFYSYGDAMLIL
jgi:S-adenosylmethionine:tRNA ribosyltransferase-isomerase